MRLQLYFRVFGLIMDAYIKLQECPFVKNFFLPVVELLAKFAGT